MSLALGTELWVLCDLGCATTSSNQLAQENVSLFGCDNSTYLGKVVRHSSPVEGYMSDDVLSFRQGRIQRQRKVSFSLQILTNHTPCKKRGRCINLGKPLFEFQIKASYNQPTYPAGVKQQSTHNQPPALRHSPPAPLQRETGPHPQHPLACTSQAYKPDTAPSPHIQGSERPSDLCPP